MNDVSVRYRPLSPRNLNLRQRMVVVLVALPGLAWVIAEGGWLYTLTFAIILSLAAKEFGLLLRTKGHRPAVPILIVGVLALSVGRYLWGLSGTAHLLAVLCLAGQVWHVVDYERGATSSGTDFALTMGGLLLCGWIGPYLISLRNLPDGLWWVLIVLPCVWTADGFAYVVGHAIGKRPLCPRLSPSKTWEGYFGGVLGGALAGYLLPLLWRAGFSDTEPVTMINGLIVGIILGVLTPLGDLNISMIKREYNAKDTSTFIPGHGGLLDRLDSWLWAGILGYYIVLFLQNS
ncbi:MAG: CDP-archaeol synthase [Anaerolineales bacterium]